MLKMIKNVVNTAPLHLYSSSNDKLCNNMLTVLKKMRGVSLIKPAIEVNSYEDPELEPVRRRVAK